MGFADFLGKVFSPRPMQGTEGVYQGASPFESVGKGLETVAAAFDPTLDIGDVSQRHRAEEFARIRKQQAAHAEKARRAAVQRQTAIDKWNATNQAYGIANEAIDIKSKELAEAASILDPSKDKEKLDVLNTQQKELSKARSNLFGEYMEGFQEFAGKTGIELQLPVGIKKLITSKEAAAQRGRAAGVETGMRAEELISGLGLPVERAADIKRTAMAKELGIERPTAAIKPGAEITWGTRQVEVEDTETGETKMVTERYPEQAYEVSMRKDPFTGEMVPTSYTSTLKMMTLRPGEQIQIIDVRRGLAGPGEQFYIPKEVDAKDVMSQQKTLFDMGEKIATTAEKTWIEKNTTKWGNVDETTGLPGNMPAAHFHAGLIGSQILKVLATPTLPKELKETLYQTWLATLYDVGEISFIDPKTDLRQNTTVDRLIETYKDRLLAENKKMSESTAYARAIRMMIRFIDMYPTHIEKAQYYGVVAPEK